MSNDTAKSVRNIAAQFPVPKGTIKDAVQAPSHFTYIYVLLYAAVWQVLSKHESSSQGGNTLRILHYYKRNTLAII